MKNYIGNNNIEVSANDWIKYVMQKVESEKEKRESQDRLMTEQLKKATGGKNIIFPKKS